MARVFDGEREDFCRPVVPVQVTGPPWWLCVWINPAAVNRRQVIFYLGSRATEVSYYGLEILPGGNVAATSTGPWHGRAAAVSPAPLPPGMWQPIVAEWPASFRRAIHTRAGSVVNTTTVSVPFVDELALGRASTARPHGYFSGALAAVAMGVGVLTNRQIAALLSGVDVRLVVPRAMIRSLWPLEHGHEDRCGVHPLVPHGEPVWEPGPVTVGPLGGFFHEASSSTTGGRVWGWVEAAQVVSSQVEAGQVVGLSAKAGP